MRSKSQRYVQESKSGFSIVTVAAISRLLVCMGSWRRSTIQHLSPSLTLPTWSCRMACLWFGLPGFAEGILRAGFTGPTSCLRCVSKRHQETALISWLAGHPALRIGWRPPCGTGFPGS